MRELVAFEGCAPSLHASPFHDFCIRSRAAVRHGTPKDFANGAFSLVCMWMESINNRPVYSMS